MTTRTAITPPPPTDPDAELRRAIDTAGRCARMQGSRFVVVSKQGRWFYAVPESLLHVFKPPVYATVFATT